MYLLIVKENNPYAAKVCCQKNPCQNGGTCIPVMRSGKRSFICSCKVGYTGKICEKKAHGCDDYLRVNISVSSGVYQIQLGEQGQTKKVYCHFDHVNLEAWTLVLSYSLSNNNIFKWLALNQDHPFNEDNPVFDKYRASLGLMTYLKETSALWRVTCNFDTKVNDDFMQSHFSSLDIMENGKH